MDSFPFEVLVHILQYTQLDDKYRLTRVNRLWRQAGKHVISEQKRLLVYPDDAPDAGQSLCCLSALRAQLIPRIP